MQYRQPGLQCIGVEVAELYYAGVLESLISSYQADDDWAAVELFFTSQLSLELLLAVTPL